MRNFTFFWMLLIMPGSILAQRSATFEDLSIGASGYWNGSDGSGKFTNGLFTFYNRYNADWFSWSGFSYTNHTDTVTPGWMNQYSAITGSGVGQSEKYAVAYVVGTTRITLAEPDLVSGMYITNSTYAYLSMRKGDDYTKKFGGASGNDPDFFRLNIHGIKSNGDTSKTVVFYLADFRFEQNEKDYLVKSWEWVNLDTLGVVSEIHFSLESSDVGAWGMNTPAYICLDNINQKSITTHSRNNLSYMEYTQVYPNPFVDKINLKFSEGNYSIELRDMRGVLLYNNQVNRQRNFQVNIQEPLAQGIYLLTVKDGYGYVKSFKIQKVNR